MCPTQDRVGIAHRKRPERVDSFLNILKESGRELTPEQLLVDFGCGDGSLVNEFRRRGFTASGCDIELAKAELNSQLEQSGILRLIRNSPYRLPYDDASVDVIISDQVMEHVADYSRALEEMYRILRPGGIGLHIFPARYCLIEPHVLIPLATLLRSRWWLWLWALLGVRNVFQTGLPLREVVERNSSYLREHTFYHSKKALRESFRRFFPVVLFREDLFLQQSRRARAVLGSLRSMRFAAWLYSAVKCRVVFTCKNI